MYEDKENINTNLKLKNETLIIKKKIPVCENTIKKLQPIYQPNFLSNHLKNLGKYILNKDILLGKGSFSTVY